MTSGAPKTINIPPEVSVDFPIGTVITFEQAGLGALTITPGAGVTINSYLGATQLVGQFAIAGATKDAADTWSLYGNIS